tara:strand:+ start:283 stop:534 length:252 start_codon:yes stop_codon:yes gene_type:complete
MTNQKAWMFFNTETPLPKNQEYYTEEEIVESMQKYADQQLILSGVSQQRELLKAYDEFAETEHDWFIGTEKETKDKFLASNCG